MATNGSQSPISIPALLIDAARLHWAHVLTLLATTVIFAPGFLAGMSIIDASIQVASDAADSQAPSDMAVDPLGVLVGLLIILAMSAAAFVLWLRIAAFGLAPAINQPARAWVAQILRTSMLLIGAGLMVSVPLVFIVAVLVGASGSLSPGAAVFLAVAVTLATNGAIALLFLPLAEGATGRQHKTSPQAMLTASRIRTTLATTLIVATFALGLTGSLLLELLTAIDAQLSALLVQALALTISITYVGAILGCAYRQVGGTMSGGTS